MDPVSKDVKDAVCEAEKFFSVTLAKEKLSPAAEKERSLLADRFIKLKIQLGCENDRPGGGKAPPRPPKGGMAISEPSANAAQEGGEIYDDVADIIPQDDYCEMEQGADGTQNQPHEASPDTGGENYEVMSADETNETAAAGEDYMAMDDENQAQENYEEPQPEVSVDDNYEITENDAKQQPSVTHDDEYEMPGADSDYEEADQSSASGTVAPVETDSMYEGVEPGTGEGAVDGVTTKERSGTVNWDHLTKDTKSENIEGAILTGFLKKLRKEGKIYVGSKYQRRYCVVRNHIFYYYREKKLNKQAGHILLPGYKAQVCNKKGREFILTHSDGYRAFQFESNSKEETEKWIAAIQKACDAPLAERHSAYLEELRNKQPSGDEDSLHYADAGQANTSTEAVEESNEDVYDDTNEDLYEVVGSMPSPAPNQPSQPIQDVDYEISAAAMSSTPAPVPAEPVQPIEEEEEYEVADQPTPPPSPPSLPPPRPTKSPAQPPPVEDTPPAPPPPRPSKSQPPAPTPPQQDDMYEIADTPGGTSDLPPPSQSVIEEENYELPESPAPPPMRPPKIPQPQIPQTTPSHTETPEKTPERPARPGPKPQPPKRKDEPPQSPKEEPKIEINYANIYQALWNCDAGEADELGFQRGDLIYIYEKPHPDWWIGSLFKPQGYSVGLVPKQYVMEAYEISA